MFARERASERCLAAWRRRSPRRTMVYVCQPHVLHVRSRPCHRARRESCRHQQDWRRRSPPRTMVYVCQEIKIKGEEESVTRKSASWSSREWHPKTNLQSSPVDAGAQSSQDKWKKQALRMKWKVVSHTVDDLGFLVKKQEGYQGQKL